MLTQGPHLDRCGLVCDTHLTFNVPVQMYPQADLAFPPQYIHTVSLIQGCLRTVLTPVSARGELVVTFTHHSF